MRVGTALPNVGHFLSAEETMEIVQGLTELPDKKEIPKRIFGNEYFLLNDEKNTEKRERGQKCLYPDILGAIGQTSNKKHYIYKTEAGLYAYADKTRKGFFSKGGKALSDECENDIIAVKRYYRHCDSFTKRVTVFLSGTEIMKKLAIVEYLGEMPSKARPHGSALSKDAPSYSRTNPETIEKAKELLQMPGSSNIGIYQHLLDAGFEPRDLKQIKNLKQSMGQSSGHMQNFSDQMIEAWNLLQKQDPKNKIVRAMIGANDTRLRAPSFILYNNHSIMEIDKFCLVSKNKPVVLCVDRTYNLGNLCNLVLLSASKIVFRQ